MLRGTLDTFSVGELLWLLGRSHVTGTLRVQGTSPGIVHCRDGFVSWASIHHDDDLTDLLARAGVIPGGLDRAAAADVVDQELRHGASAQRIHELVRTATEDAVFELASWASGEVRFDVEPPHQFAESFCYPVVAVLDAVSRRRARWAELVERLGSPNTVFAQSAALQQGDDDLTISRSQWRVLAAIDGHRSVVMLARELGLGLFAAAEIMVALVDGGLVTPVGAGAPAQAADLPRRAGTAADQVSVLEVPVRPHGAPARHLTAVPAGPEAAPYANGNGTAVLTAPTPSEAEEPLAALAAELGLPTADYVNAGDRPSRDLILRLLSAVKEL